MNNSFSFDLASGWLSKVARRDALCNVTHRPCFELADLTHTETDLAKIKMIYIFYFVAIYSFKIFYSYPL